MTRAYRSDLRAEQAERTRERIVEALADQLGEGLEEFSIPRVAERAGVSVRTVYHHFPNREAQIEAVARWLDGRITGGEPPPASLGDILPMLARIVRRSVENQREVRAQLVPGVARHVRERRRRARERGIERLVVEHTELRAGRLAAAVLNLIIGADVAFALMDRYGLSDEDMVASHLWLVRVVLDAIRRRDVPTSDPPSAPPAAERGASPRSRSTPSGARPKAGGSR